MTDVVEFASRPGRCLSAYEGAAKWAGVSLQNVIDAAQEDRLGELIESRQHGRPLSGAEALRRIGEKRYAPGTKPQSAAALLGELRAKRLIWEAQEEDIRRSRDPLRRLPELYAKRVPPREAD